MKQLLGLMLLLLITAFILNSCGSSSGTTPVINTPTQGGGTPTPTPSSGTNPVQKDALTTYLVNSANSAGIMTVLDYSALASSSLESSDTITIPPTPSSPPVIPSGTYTYTNTYNIGTNLTASINSYVYITGLPITGPALAKEEWKETDAYLGTTLDYGYGLISEPTPQGGTTVSRNFSLSRWATNNSNLLTYTTGTTTSNTADTGSGSVTGTQVIFLPKPINGKQQIAYSFTATKNSNGSVSGSITFDNGSGSFNRTAPNQNAIGTDSVYYQTTGNASITSPVSKTISFTFTVYGNYSSKLVVTTNNIATTLNINADGSGSGTVTGILGSITLTWDSTGSGTATITTTGRTIPIFVPVSEFLYNIITNSLYYQLQYM